MNAELIGELHDALGAIAADRACRVVVLTGAGRGFCAGWTSAATARRRASEGLGGVEATFATQTAYRRAGPAPARRCPSR